MIPEPVIEIHLTGERFTDSAIRFHSIFESLLIKSVSPQTQFLEYANDLVDDLLNRKM